MYCPSEAKHKTCICHNHEYCSLCGSESGSIAFKAGYICESCMDYIKSST